jgi:hypothetical protein
MTPIEAFNGNILKDFEEFPAASLDSEIRRLIHHLLEYRISYCIYSSMLHCYRLEILRKFDADLPNYKRLQVTCKSHTFC